jgi:hypothetical protein
VQKFTACSSTFNTHALIAAVPVHPAAVARVATPLAMPVSTSQATLGGGVGDGAGLGAGLGVGLGVGVLPPHPTNAINIMASMICFIVSPIGWDHSHSVNVQTYSRLFDKWKIKLNFFECCGLKFQNLLTNQIKPFSFWHWFICDLEFLFGLLLTFLTRLDFHVSPLLGYI